MGTRIRITNNSKQPQDIGGRWVQPGASDVFDADQVAPEWRAGAVVVESDDPRAGELEREGDRLYVRKADGSRNSLVEAGIGPGGGDDFPGLPRLTAAVRNAVQYIVSHADLDARPPRLWPVDSVPYRLFCQVGGLAFGHGDSNRTLATVDTATRTATTGHVFPDGSILDIFPGFGCALVVHQTAAGLRSLYRTVDGQSVELVHDFGRDPDGSVHRPHPRLLMRGLERGYLDGQPALVMATYNDGNTSIVDGTPEDAIYIAKSLDDGRTWERVNTWNYDFATATGAHNVRHFHAVRYDQWRDCWWFAAGDTDAESAIIRWDGRSPAPGNVSMASIAAGNYPGWMCRTGAQRWRAVDLLVTEGWIESFTDTVSDVTGGIWRMRPDFSGSHRVDHSVRGAQHDGWSSLLHSGGTHIWCDSCRADTSTVDQRYVGLYASANGARYFEIGRVALADETNVAKLPRGLFEDPQGLVWFSQSSEAGKTGFWTTAYRLQGRFIDERPDNLAPCYFVDPVNGDDAATGWSANTAWKTVKNAVSGNKVTPGARIMIAAGSSVETGVGSIEYSANARPAHATSFSVHFSGQGADATSFTPSVSTNGWRGLSTQMWNLEFTHMHIGPTNTSIFHDNSTQTAGTPKVTVRDSIMGSLTSGTRMFYPRASEHRAVRCKLQNTVDTTKQNATPSGSGKFTAEACIINGGRINVETGGALTLLNNTLLNYSPAGVTMIAGATVAPKIVQNVFAGTSAGLPIANSSALVLDATTIGGNYYGRPMAEGLVPESPLQIAGPLAWDETTLTPFEWSPLVGAAQPAGVSWDYYGNPFRARPAIGAVEIPPEN